MVFAAPLALFAFLSVLVPLLIHLRSSPPRRIQRVGSLQLFRAAFPAPLRRKRPQQWMLLALRMLLLAALALLLSRPLMRRPLLDPGAKGYAFVPPEQLDKAWAQQQPLLDSLISAGYHLHAFSPGFERVSPAQRSLASAEISAPALSYSSLIEALGPPAKSQLYFFSLPRASWLGERLPALPERFHWVTLQEDAAAGSWIEPGFSGRLRGTSTARGMIYEPADSLYRPVSVLLHQTDQPAQGQQDASIRAALSVLAGAAQAELLVQHWDPQAPVQDADWGLWLSGQPLSIEFLRSLRKGGTLLRYAPGKDSLLQPAVSISPEDFSFDRSGPLQQYKSVAGEPPAGEVVWENAQGVPLLSRTQQEGREVYSLFLRFTSEYSTLAESKVFLQLLQGMFFDPMAAVSGYQKDSLLAAWDRRSWQSGLLQNDFPSRRAEKGVADALQKRSSLEDFFKLLILLLFLAERALSFWTQREERRENGRA